MQAHLIDWLHLLVRWAHITVGIAWIGASFYFNWLENNLNRTKDLKEGRAGNLWAIHGGGVYYLEKFKNSPGKMPEVLHWFKWEAYFTWVTGFCLLAIVYYFNASSYLVDPAKFDISPANAILLSIFTLITSWFIYDILCKSPLIEKPVLFSTIGFLLLSGASYLLCQVYNDRAAYIHVGAIIGTLMAVNVFRVIIPSQKAFVAAIEKGEEPDPKLGLDAYRRSRQNNYLTLPVLFIMISNHFPATFAHQYNWLILIAVALISGWVRHYFNIRHARQHTVWILPVAFCLMVGVAVLSRPADQAPEPQSIRSKVSSVRAIGIINKHCLGCHSATPTDDIFKIAPNGVTYDSYTEIKTKADKIKTRAVDTNSMPFGNKTGMTDEERKILGDWIAAGLPLD